MALGSYRSPPGAATPWTPRNPLTRGPIRPILIDCVTKGIYETEGPALANSRSARKRMRQQQQRRLHNRTQRSRIRTAIKDVLNAPDAGTGATAFKHASALLDRMASRNLIHRNKAARKKSQLARHIARTG